MTRIEIIAEPGVPQILITREFAACRLTAAQLAR
jgi:hypothetical protein